MFAVALAATAHVGMERRRLALQERGVIRVADNATGGLDSFAGSVAGSTVVFEKCMGLGEGTGTGHALPGRFVQDPGALVAGMTSQEIKSRKQRYEQHQSGEQEASQFHENHLMLKWSAAQMCSPSRT